MFFYRRGLLSLLFVMTMSFFAGMYFNHKLNSSPTNVVIRPNDYLMPIQPVTEPVNVQDISAEEIKINFPLAMKSFQRKYVHLDLKGAPPRISYLLKLLPLFKANGVTGLLIEYEDSFPYQAEIHELSSTRPYSSQELKKFLFTVVSMGFDIIPLVQTFGHMEFALKLETYKKLRENPMYPNALCPSQEKSLELVKKMIDQVVSFHKEFGIKRLHIGCDEVFHVAECPICSAREAKDPMGNASLLLGHIKYVAQHVVGKGLVPLVWHDMLLGISGKALQLFNIPSLVEVVVWDYTPDLSYSPSHENWLKLQLLFKGKLWIGSAFKGATGVNQQFTDPRHHFENHKRWMEVAATYGSDTPFLGVMITGWQRYDHFSVLCELLPAGIPTLIFNLNYLADPTQSESQLVDRATSILKCTTLYPIDATNATEIVKCNFPGSKLHTMIHELYLLEKEYRRIMSGSHMVGWMTQFHVENDFANPDHIRLAMRGTRYLSQRYYSMAPVINAELFNIFERETLDEWLDLNFFVVKEQLKQLERNAEKLMSMMSWKRRYFDLNKSFLELKARKTLNLTHFV